MVSQAHILHFIDREWARKEIGDCAQMMKMLKRKVMR
jgi:hypothetical protein